MKNERALGAERAAAALDRATWINWKPSRGYQCAHALVDALVKSNLSKFTSNIAERITINVRTMR